MVFIAVLFFLLQIDAIACDYAFVSSSKFSNAENEIDGHLALAYNRIYGKPLALSKSGYYIFVTKEGLIDEFSVAYFPLNKAKATVSYVPEIPYYIPGPETGKWLECNSKLILKHKDKIKSFCEKEMKIPDSTQNLISKFFEEHRETDVGSLGWGTGGLHIVQIDEQNNRSYLHVSSPKTQNVDCDGDLVVSDYLKFYAFVMDLTMNGFEKCRWTNFGNAADILKECRKYVPKELKNDAKFKSQILQDSK